MTEDVEVRRTEYVTGPMPPIAEDDARAALIFVASQTTEATDLAIRTLESMVTPKLSALGLSKEQIHVFVCATFFWMQEGCLDHMLSMASPDGLTVQVARILREG